MVFQLLFSNSCKIEVIDVLIRGAVADADAKFSIFDSSALKKQLPILAVAGVQCEQREMWYPIYYGLFLFIIRT